MTISPGSQIAHYEIGPRLGSGGMGEVYFARDVTLRRPVALKLLIAEFTDDQDRLRRFEQEARATSALNHPNILTIYEIGKWESRHYIATEFVEGKTLRQLISRGRLHWTEAVDMAIQVAMALSAAHANGIVHRDIKPENLMLRTDGYVKVLDFGLAKLTEPETNELSGSQASTSPVIHTAPGTVIGTVAYMSPEQLRLQDIDGSTDLWSLGAVLYEMIVGRPPFATPTISDCIAAILDHEPVPFAQADVEAPSELQRIVTKALQKRREERYRTAAELIHDLKNLKQDAELNSRANLPTLAIADAGTMGRGRSNTSGNVEPNQMTARTEIVRSAKRSLSVRSLIDELNQHRNSVLLVLAVVACTVALAIFFPKSRPRRAGPMKLTRLITTTGVREAALSPDGKYVVSVVEDSGKQRILVRQILTSSEVEIVPPSQEDYRGVVFSRDANYIYYLKQQGDMETLFQVPALGGTSRRLSANINTPVTLSPDGKQMAFLRRKANEIALIVANTDGTQEKELRTTMTSNIFSISSDLNNAPAWSPDGQVIVCPAKSVDEPFHYNVVAVRVADGTVRLVNSRPWYLIGQIAWLSDGSGLVMNAEDQAPPLSTFQIWLLSNADGAGHRITNDLSFYRSVSLSQDSSALLTTQSYTVSTIWIVSGPDYDQSLQIAGTRNKGTGGLAWTFDNRIVYASAESGNQEIWSMDLQGNSVRRLTFNEYSDAEPAVSRNGRYIVFASYPRGKAHIWRMNPDGSDQKQLTSGSAEDSPRCTPDSRWIVYHGADSSGDSIFKVSTDGGTPIRLTDLPAMGPDVSPSGNLLAFFSKGQQAESPWRIVVTPFDRHEQAKTFVVPATACPNCFGVRWMPDERALTYICTSAGVSNIWSQPLTGGAPKALTHFQEHQIDSFAWSPDGKQLACVRSAAEKELVLLNDFR